MPQLYLQRHIPHSPTTMTASVPSEDLRGKWKTHDFGGIYFYFYISSLSVLFFCFLLLFVVPFYLLTPKEFLLLSKAVVYYSFLEFRSSGKYISLGLFYFVNLTSSCPLIPPAILLFCFHGLYNFLYNNIWSKLLTPNSTSHPHLNSLFCLLKNNVANYFLLQLRQQHVWVHSGKFITVDFYKTHNFEWG